MSATTDRRRSDAATRVIDASPDTIYQGFATAEALMQWLPPAGMSGRALEYDFQEGGRYRIELRYDEKLSAEPGKTTDRRDITDGFSRGSSQVGQDYERGTLPLCVRQYLSSRCR